MLAAASIEANNQAFGANVFTTQREEKNHETRTTNLR